jgi:hypothetical protein
LPTGALTATNPDPQLGYGIVGRTDGSENGTVGVVGFASATSVPGQTYGVEGFTRSPNGIGVYGASYGSDSVPGVGIGVLGQSYVPGGTGGAFQSASPDGASLLAYDAIGHVAFSVLASGKTGIGTDAPTQAVDVVGNVKADGLCIGTDCRNAWPSGGGGSALTGVTAGQGLTGGGTTGNVTLDVNTSVIQSRVSGNCAAGTAIQTVNGDGTVGCAIVGGGGLTGAGQIGFLPKYTSPNTVADSQVGDDGSRVFIGTPTVFGKLSVQGGSDVGGAFQTNVIGGIALLGQTPDTGSNNSETIGVKGISPGVGGVGVDGEAGGIGVQGQGSIGVGGFSSDPAGTAGLFQSFDATGTALLAKTSDYGSAFVVKASGKVGILNADPAEALEVNGNVKANGLCIGTDCRTAWPSGGSGGGGTITWVRAGAGHPGGAATGDVTLGIANGAVTNAMLQNPSLTITAGTGLTGGGAVSLGTPTSLAIDTTVVPRLTTTNSFSAQQNVSIATLVPAITGVNAATSGAGYGVLGRSSSNSGRGLFGDATAGTGVSYGVYGQTASVTLGAAGVYGTATAGTGNIAGVSGATASTGGTGVTGVATATSGTTWGGFFQSLSPSGVGAQAQGGNTGVNGIGGNFGITGQTTNSTGSSAGVLGSTASSSGMAVEGVANSPTGAVYGVYGIAMSPSGTGVYGQATSATGTTFGVYGIAMSPTGYGVYSLGNAHVEGNLSYSGTLTQSSSRRWKTNIAPMTGALAKVQQLQGVTYDWRASGRHDIGLIAEDVHRVVPEVVAMEENGVDAKGVDYARLTSLLIEAVKEQQKEIDALHAAISDLTQRLAGVAPQAGGAKQ